MPDIPTSLIENPLMVVHVIVGIDDVDEVKALHTKGIRKVLVLGEKDFGFNEGRVDTKSPAHLKWYRKVHELFKVFDIVSFDNLSLEQLNIRRFVKDWDTMYQGEYSMYINAVQRYYAPSSRSSSIYRYGDNPMPIKEYFMSLFPWESTTPPLTK
jgi:hypothetical protein